MPVSEGTYLVINKEIFIGIIKSDCGMSGGEFYSGDPGGIRTPDLHRDRVACLSATPRGHSSTLGLRNK